MRAWLQVVHALFYMADSLFCLGFRDEEAEKLSKGDEEAAVAVSAEASQTMPQVPITTPPPPVTDMSGQAAYGGYSSWYQVGSHIQYMVDQKCQQTFGLCNFLFILSFQQPQYGNYGYQNTWNYNQGYYPTS